MAFGPYSKTDATRRAVIRVGIVGPAEAVDKGLSLIERFSRPTPCSEKLDSLLHPSFPGINASDPFQVELVNQQVWRRNLKPADIAQVENNPSFTDRVRLLRDAVKAEIVALSKLDIAPDVVLVCMNQKLEELCRVGIAKHDLQERLLAQESDDVEDVLEEIKEETEEDDEDESHKDEIRSFRRSLKADCLDLLPTQLLWHRTLAGSAGVQDPATRAWNICVALLYKTSILPWRLADVMDGACFVGISFFRPDQAKASILRTSVAQAFTDRGEGFILQGDTFEWNATKEGEAAPHLSSEAAKALLKRVLEVYEEQQHTRPRYIVIHKSSRYTDEEHQGFTQALDSIQHYAMVTISRRGIFCLRPGNKATLRGTLINFGEKRGLIYTTGYVPFLRCYPGFRIPQPLEILENWGSLSLYEVAQDILRLTKLNWNSAAFCCLDPITLAFSRRVGDILKCANTSNPALHYRYYM